MDQGRNDLDGTVIENVNFGYLEENSEGNCTEPFLKVHATECNKYMICEFGILHEQSCPSELYFNKVTKDNMLNIKK